VPMKKIDYIWSGITFLVFLILTFIAIHPNSITGSISEIVRFIIILFIPSMSAYVVFSELKDFRYKY